MTDADGADFDPLSSILKAVTDLRDQVDDLSKGRSTMGRLPRLRRDLLDRPTLLAQVL